MSNYSKLCKPITALFVVFMSWKDTTRFQRTREETGTGSTLVTRRETVIFDPMNKILKNIYPSTDRRTWVVWQNPWVRTTTTGSSDEEPCRLTIGGIPPLGRRNTKVGTQRWLQQRETVTNTCVDDTCKHVCRNTAVCKLKSTHLWFLT